MKYLCLAITGEADTSSNTANSCTVGARYQSVKVRYILTDVLCGLSGKIPQHL